MQLRQSSLPTLPAAVAKPAYDRGAIGVGTLHLGVGGFHRAHQLVYTDELLANDGGDWACCGVGLLPDDKAMAEALLPQDCLYTLVVRSATGNRARVIGALTDYLHGAADPRAAVERMADPAVRIVSLTVTEKGYCQSQSGGLDPEHPMIAADLRDLDRPRSALGYLVAALRLRRERDLPPFTVMSCDNLPGNGELTRELVRELAAQIDPEIARWIAQSVAFPNSMVDRITPMTTDEDRRLVSEEFGIEDAWPVVCEEFRQWVIEDRFCNGRPPWENVGVQFVPNVRPYEKMKVRLLNGSHSALAYPAYLLGHREVDRAMRDPLIAGFVRALMGRELTATLDPVPGIDLAAYKATLLERFSNPAIKDQVQRLAQDGSRKIANALLPALRERLAEGRSVSFLCLALACWIRYLRGEDEHGRPIEIGDPLAALLNERARLGGTDPRPLLAVGEVFGPDLGNDQTVVATVGEALANLDRTGTAATLRAWLLRDR